MGVDLKVYGLYFVAVYFLLTLASKLPEVLRLCCYKIQIAGADTAVWDDQCIIFSFNVHNCDSFCAGLSLFLHNCYT